MLVLYVLTLHGSEDSSRFKIYYNCLLNHANSRTWLAVSGVLSFDSVVNTITTIESINK